VVRTPSLAISAPRPKIESTRPFKARTWPAAESLLGEVREQWADLDTWTPSSSSASPIPEPDQ
jgi:hypothetical protein